MYTINKSIHVSKIGWDRIFTYKISHLRNLNHLKNPIIAASLKLVVNEWSVFFFTLKYWQVDSSIHNQPAVTWYTPQSKNRSINMYYWSQPHNFDIQMKK